MTWVSLSNAKKVPRIDTAATNNGSPASSDANTSTNTSRAPAPPATISTRMLRRSPPLPPSASSTVLVRPTLSPRSRATWTARSIGGRARA